MRAAPTPAFIEAGRKHLEAYRKERARLHREALPDVQSLPAFQQAIKERRNVAMMSDIRDGLSYYAAAKRYGVSLRRVREIATQYCIPGPGRPPVRKATWMSERKDARNLNLYKDVRDGMSHQDASKKYAITTCRVAQIIREIVRQYNEHNCGAGRAPDRALPQDPRQTAG